MIYEQSHNLAKIQEANAALEAQRAQDVELTARIERDLKPEVQDYANRGIPLHKPGQPFGGFTDGDLELQRYINPQTHPANKANLHNTGSRNRRPTTQELREGGRMALEGMTGVLINGVVPTETEIEHVREQRKIGVKEELTRY